MRVRVKICGITRLEDALVAARLGADALGFNLWPGSKRFIEAAAARAIVDRLPPFVAAVGVFVNQPAEEVATLAAQAGLGLVQLHGDESPEEAERCPLPVVKALRLEGPATLVGLDRWRVRALLLDAPSVGFGGSGRTCDWELARGVVEQLGTRQAVVLAGGLHADNVREAIRAVRPWAVDVASGVESSPGVKDPDELQRFLRSAGEGDRVNTLPAPVERAHRGARP